MAKHLFHALTFSVAAAAGSAPDAGIKAHLAELDRLIKEDGARLNSLAKERHLLVKSYAVTTTGSLYGDQPGTAVYTASESQTMAMDHVWMILCGSLVMFMQAGFAVLEAGCCRVKNVQSILLKNLTDVCVGTLGWWILGYSFAFSGPFNSDGYKDHWHSIGYKQFAGHEFVAVRSDHQMEPTTDIVKWFFQWAFAATAATIVSGGVAERVNFPGYCIFSFLMTAGIYPVVVAWTWGNGWLADMNSPGYMDFAGSGVVHLTGGIAALVGAAIAGPRNGRFDGLGAKARVMDLPQKFWPHSQPLIALGTFILWFGWYGFNCGSTLGMAGIETAFMAAQVAMNTTIAAAVGGLTVFILRKGMMKKYDLGGMCNGILAGLVSITAGCGNVECGSAAAIGAAGGVVFQMASSFVRILKIDDPIDAFAVHGACGIWGVIAAVLFDWGRGFSQVHGWKGFKCDGWKRTTLGCPNDGTDKQGGNLAAANFAEIGAIIAWSGGCSAIIFFILKVCKLLRAADNIQEPGIDKSKHSPDRGYDNQYLSYDDEHPLKSI